MSARRDRDGEVIEDDDIDPTPHRCRKGWTGEDAEGRPVPCLTCKPHLRCASCGQAMTSVRPGQIRHPMCAGRAE